MRQKIQRKFAQWRQEPPEVRLRIATVLAAGTGLVVALVWLVVLLPLQLHFGRPATSDAVTEELRGAVSGVRDVPSLSPSSTPTPSPEVEYFHETRPSIQNNANPSSSP